MARASRGPTPTERADKAAAAAKAARTRAANANEKLEQVRKAGRAALQKARAAAKNRGVQQIGKALVGGAIAGVGVESLVHAAEAGTFGDGRARDWFKDERIAAAAIGVAAGGVAVLADRSKMKAKGTIGDIAAAAVAGAAAVMARPVLRQALAPEPVRGLRFDYGPAPVGALQFAQAPARFVAPRQLGYAAGRMNSNHRDARLRSVL